MAVSDVAIRLLTGSDAAACDAIVAALPEHFGDPDGVAACAAAVRESAGLVAEIEGAAIGFLTWREWYGTSREITWMAVHPDHQRRGAGRALLGRMVTDASAAGARHLVVTTLARPGPGSHDTYAGTRTFYRTFGFEPVWEPQGWWNERNQAVLMLRGVVR